jgi:2-polyprenyl-3-methyl-5-hydroxy-6-metoxy-1,4-benzoquinol methylase
MASHLTGELRDFVLRWLPPHPARILDIGCGEGESTNWLAECGYDPLGVDPGAADGPRFARSRIQDFEATEPFDAGLAIRSLHHVGELDEAVDHDWW